MTSPRPRDLVTQEAQALAAELAALPDTADPQALSALRTRHPEAGPDLLAALATQARLRARAAGRLGRWAEALVLEDEALQQATRYDVATYRAARLVERLGIDSPNVADLGCGLGFDARALAEAGCRVLAVERDTWRAEAAEVNLAAYGDRIHVVCEDVMTLDPAVLSTCDAAYVDPARRPSGGPRRIDGGRARAVTAPESWSPPWSWVVELAQRLPVVAKVAPSFPSRLAPPRADIEWLDDGGETVEASVWLGSLGDGMRRATALSGAVAETLEAPRSGPVADGTWTDQAASLLIEPTPAVIHAELVGALADRLGAGRLEGSTWLTANEIDRTPLARAWHIIAEVPHAPRDLRTWLRGRGPVTWKTGDTRASAADWDRRVGHRPSRAPAVTIVLTSARRAFAVERPTALTENDTSSR